MEKIKIHKSPLILKESDCARLWVSKDISDRLDEISNASGLAKRIITDLLLRKAIEQVELIETDI
jgi:hypothetical protein